MSFLRRPPTGLFSSLILLLALIVAGTGCSVSNARGDYPLGNASISIGYANLGEDSTVSIWRQRSESSDCNTRSGEFGVNVDCENTRQLVSKVVSFECLPAEACKDVRIDGAKVTYVPRAENFDVHVVGDIEGDRVEKTQTMVGQRPSAQLTLQAASPSGSTKAIAIAGGRISACRAGSTSLRLRATLDGESIAVTASEEGSYSTCDTVVPSHAGTLRVVVALEDPAIDLATEEMDVRPLDDVRDVEITDALCPVGEAIHAFEHKGQWSFSISLAGTLADLTVVSVPGSAARYIDGDVELAPSSDAAQPRVGFMPKSAPSAAARIEVRIGDRVFTLPVVPTAKCN
jgi:hypothetical protein